MAMARKLRLEYPGACYHVINRGNYRGAVFKTEGARLAFEACLFEACARSGWLLHAYVVMSNHYHLAVETPKANLVPGMQWLQATFANRFNRLRGERGHLFQGRYKALVVEPGAALGLVCHYIHLNPVRAGLIPVGDLRNYRASSYWHLWRPRTRPAFLSCRTSLDEAGCLSDTRAGWQSYAAYLDWQAGAGPVGRTKAYVCMSEGWALGSAGFKQALRRDHAVATETRAWDEAGVREIRQAEWAEVLQRLLTAAGKTAEDVRRERRGAAWKAGIARQMKQSTQAGNRWLAEHLNMGSPKAVSVYVGRLRANEAR